ncbi:RpiR family transcriptional regulator [Pacificibacter maritimus]|uniref:RpiR family transcriptional regulator n=1 Tax=Pacificibacter maritimus TaxID=762213 RepID=A0A3N4UTF4_9RHOB|nr:MurR/RpiR family transcriptional regulator [Pacificibacter maritimus]RPE71985.1 RpiR family transcriptional regulator [Pacificibacter maritimus]
MSQNSLTISDRIQNHLDDLTRAERQLAHSILENYPASGLGPLSALAKDAKVSVPTVARMVQKLGFNGYLDFQTELREELKAKVQDPIAKHDTWAEAAPTEHVLNSFTDAVIHNIRQSLAHIDPVAFDQACALIADKQHSLCITGGRLTQTLAEYFFSHLQVVRPKVTHIQSSSSAWPHYLLDMKKDDVLVIFDMRRYENNSFKLAQMAHEKGAKVILITDQWRSPIHQIADFSFSCRIVVPSAWDSAVTPLLLLETMISTVQNLTWGETKGRIKALEDMFDQTKQFRKFT